MSQWAAITVLGRDRPGIVAAVSKVLFEHGCNIEDSSATRLRDSFAMILIAKLPDPPRLEALESALQACAGVQGISIDVRDLGGGAPEPPPAGDAYLLSVYGADRPGIVYRVSATLAGLRCNVTDVATRVAGTIDAPVYILMLELTAPPDVSAAELERHLAALRTELNVDLTLRPIEQETL